MVRNLHFENQICKTNAVDFADVRYTAGLAWPLSDIAFHIKDTGMSFLIYAGDGKSHHAPPSPPSQEPQDALQRPEAYLADTKLVDSVNVALLLGQPLLITGESGSGKTQLAHSLAWELNLGPPLVFTAQPTSLPRDLFYTYDARGHYQAAQQSGRSEPLKFLHYHALGEAILRANDPDKVTRFIPPNLTHTEKRRHLVLIDEIDQAPDNFAEGLGQALERMSFRVRELGNTELNAETDMQPIVVLTSDLRKPLSQALLKVCTHYELAFPDVERIRAIVAARLGENAGLAPAVFNDALGFFLNLRQETPARPRPGLDELLHWLLKLKHSVNGHEYNVFTREPDLVVETLDQLVTRTQDLKHADVALSEWLMMQRQR